MTLMWCSVAAGSAGRAARTNVFEGVTLRVMIYCIQFLMLGAQKILGIFCTPIVAWVDSLSFFATGRSNHLQASQSFYDRDKVLLGSEECVLPCLLGEA